MKKLIPALLLIVYGTHVSGQEKDTRAELKTGGRIIGISVSPDERILLVDNTGATFYTDNIRSNWKYGTVVVKEDESLLTRPTLDDVTFFNSDTAVITGYISKESHKKNGYYRTTNGGKNWQLLDYGGDSWIYTVYGDKQGNAWLGGLKKEIYYTSDYGASWQTKKIPLKSSDRIYGLDMINGKEGIASSDGNEIVVTTDNWKTVKNIPTPNDQVKHKKAPSGYSDERIDAAVAWGDYYLVYQYKHYYYTDKKEIAWKELPVEISSFEADKKTNSLYAISKDRRAMLFKTPESYVYLSNRQLDASAARMTVMNNALYVVDYTGDVYKISATEFIKVTPYTIEHKIETPQVTTASKTLVWGATGNQLYLSDNNGEDWYRENAVPLYVQDIAIMDDSTVLLWNGVNKNYKYSLKTHKAELYKPEKPMDEFLKYPVTSFRIISGSRGCFHNYSNEIEYTATKDETFVTAGVEKGSYGEENTKKYRNEVNGKLLGTILNSVNADPSKLPALKDFKITEQDKKNYLKLIDEKMNKKRNDEPLNKEDKAYYYSIPDKLSGISDSVLLTTLDCPERVWSTTSNWFTVQLINEHKDTLNIGRKYYVSSTPWNLPWKMEYRGLHFNCYDVAFSEFISDCIPDDFMGKLYFDNSLLLLQIAEALKPED